MYIIIIVHNYIITKKKVKIEIKYICSNNAFSLPRVALSLMFYTYLKFLIG